MPMKVFLGSESVARIENFAYFKVHKAKQEMRYDAHM